ncbi:unnamed protein product [Tilletia caries]|uniref:FAD-binding FR-type domain-containing protein n=2 Tax=Tilletia caries TaxID=13290 RepID=A0ABN7IS60_9BASI|nr:unnamed protein product [Tilletia caries]CAD6916693.1 unnamed protein product [Tilletia caries]CAD7065393.1 unnamed protein product [Tilletia caries]
MVLFWKVYPENLEGLSENYPGKEADATATIYAFYFSGFEVPAIAIFALYIVLVTLIATNIFRKSLKLLAPHFYASQRARLAWLRANFLNASLIGRKHSEPVYLFGRRWLPVRIPLRFQSFVILALFLFNVLVYTRQYVRYLADRSCVLAMGQLPIVFLSAGRYSPLALITGLPFSDSMLYHRWLARMVWLQVSVHSFAYTYLEVRSDYLAEVFKQAYWNWGVAATAMFWGLTILAYGQLRSRAYEVFVTLHVVMGILALVGTYYHIRLLAFWRFKVYIILTELSAAIWAFDRVARTLNRCYLSLRLRRQGFLSTATVTAHADDLLRVRIKLPVSRLRLAGEEGGRADAGSGLSSGSLVTRIAPGHSVRILVPRIQFFSDHPFTVLGTGGEAEGDNDVDDMGYVDLLVRKQKGFTKHLSKLEATTGSVDVESRGQGFVKQSAVIVEGPYGELHYDEVHNASHVLLFAGGVGVAYTLPYMIETALGNRRNVPCTMTWMIRDIALFNAVMDQLTGTVQELAARAKTAAEEMKRAPLLINLHMTSSKSATTQEPFAPIIISELDKRHDAAGKELASSSSSAEEKEEEEGEGESGRMRGTPETEGAGGFYDYLEPYFRVTTSFGRANVCDTIASAAAAADEGKRRLVVMSCGPTSLCDDVRYEAQRALRSGAWEDVGYFEECFSW